MRKRGTTALLMTAAVLAASSPEATASPEKLSKRADPTNVCKKANNNKSNQSLRKLVRQISSKFIDFKPRQANGFYEYVGIREGSSTNGGGARTVTLDTGESSVTGSSGKYNMEVSAVDVGNDGGLDVNDVNRVKVTLGSSDDSGPLFGLTLHRMQKRWTDGPRDANCWYHVSGTAIMPTGQRVSFNGTPDPRYTSQPEIFLDGQEAANTGTVMSGIINDALNARPTHLVQPPLNQPQ